MYASPRTAPVRARPTRPVAEISEIIASATLALREAARLETEPTLEEVARWCAEVGGVDPRLERAALLHAIAMISPDALIEDVAATLRARLIAAGPLLPALIACGGIPWVLASLGLDEAEPPPEALSRRVPPRVARFYWRRLRAYVAWSASANWS